MDAFQNELLFTKMVLIGEGCDPTGASKPNDKDQTRNGDPNQKGLKLSKSKTGLDNNSPMVKSPTKIKFDWTRTSIPSSIRDDAIESVLQNRDLGRNLDKPTRSFDQPTAQQLKTFKEKLIKQVEEQKKKLQTNI